MEFIELHTNLIPCLPCIPVSLCSGFPRDFRTCTCIFHILLRKPATMLTYVLLIGIFQLESLL